MNGALPRKLVWFITGTSSGFGRRMVQSALARGDYVVATARNLSKIQDFPTSDRLRLLQLDVTSGPERIAAQVATGAQLWGRIDVLVNNAGYGSKSILEEAGSEQCRLQYETNVFGLIDVTTAVLPYMRKRRSGTVVMIGSRSGWRGDILSSTIYASSKAAVHAYSEGLAVELEPFSIRVLIVEPGSFRTENIFSYPFYLDNPIPDYDELRAKAVAKWDPNALLPGDPAKAVEVIVDVVRGEGKARGRPWPLYLVLGPNSEKSIMEKIDKFVGTMNSWRDVTSDMELNEKTE